MEHRQIVDGKQQLSLASLRIPILRKSRKRARRTDSSLNIELSVQNSNCDGEDKVSQSLLCIYQPVLCYHFAIKEKKNSYLLVQQKSAFSTTLIHLYHQNIRIHPKKGKGQSIQGGKLFSPKTQKNKKERKILSHLTAIKWTLNSPCLAKKRNLVNQNGRLLQPCLINTLSSYTLRFLLNLIPSFNQIQNSCTV